MTCGEKPPCRLNFVRHEQRRDMQNKPGISFCNTDVSSTKQALPSFPVNRTLWRKTEAVSGHFKLETEK